MRANGNFGFRLNNKDYIFEYSGISRPSVLGLEFLKWLNSIKSNEKIIDLINSFEIEKSDEWASDSYLQKIIARMSVGFEEKFIIRFKGNYNIGNNGTIGDVIGALYGTQGNGDRFDGLMNIKTIGTNNVNDVLLNNISNLRYLYIVNLDSNMFEFYKTEKSILNLYSRYAERKFMVGAELYHMSLLDELSLDIIYDLPVEHMKENLVEFEVTGSRIYMGILKKYMKRNVYWKVR